MQGETYLIYRQGEIIAQLGPYSQTPDPVRPCPTTEGPLDPELSALLQRLSRAYGQPHLADMLGLSPGLLHQAVQTGRLASHLLAPLDYLEDLHQMLLERRKSANHRLWITEHRRDLGGRTPLMVLRGAWRPDDPLPLHIRALAQKASRD